MKTDFFTTVSWKKTSLGTPIELYASESLDALRGQKPILLIGGVHGDEPEGVRLAQDTLKWLLEQTRLGQRLVPWVVIPCLNVDGYQRGTRVNGRGVDLNRNYPSRDWSSAFEKERYFPGSAPASEPEIQGVVELIQTLQPRLLIHCHSWEPCIVATGEQALRDARRLSRSSGYKMVPEIGYPTPGSLSRYGWHDQRIPVICIEEQDGLQNLDTVWPRFAESMREIFTDPSLRESTTPSFEHLVFDLDDTLLDTYRCLIPPATRESFEAMIRVGLDADLATCLKERENFIHSHSRQSLYQHLIHRFGVRTGADPAQIADAGYDAFHNRSVEPDIELLPGALEVLRALKPHYSLHLVTAGHCPTQNEKIRILNISHFFASVTCVDPKKNESKQNAFLRIMTQTGTPPERHLSIGNRLDTDIAEAKRVGWRTCWLKYGEYAHMQPLDELELADFEITGLTELIAKCQL